MEQGEGGQVRTTDPGAFARSVWQILRAQAREVLGADARRSARHRQLRHTQRLQGLWGPLAQRHMLGEVVAADCEAPTSPEAQRTALAPRRQVAPAEAAQGSGARLSG